MVCNVSSLGKLILSLGRQPASKALNFCCVCKFGPGNRPGTLVDSLLTKAAFRSHRRDHESEVHPRPVANFSAVLQLASSQCPRASIFGRGPDLQLKLARSTSGAPGRGWINAWQAATTTSLPPAMCFYNLRQIATDDVRI